MLVGTSSIRLAAQEPSHGSGTGADFRQVATPDEPPKAGQYHVRPDGIWPLRGLPEIEGAPIWQAR
ncbi:MAG: hypothetical protein RLZZ440_1248 [Planctomycetota bacterium]